MNLIPTNKTGENPLWKSSEPYYDDIFTLWDLVCGAWFSRWLPHLLTNPSPVPLHYITLSCHTPCCI